MTFTPGFIIVLHIVGKDLKWNPETTTMTVTLGLLGAFVWKLPNEYVYLLLSLEECVQLGISLVLFRTKEWMRSLSDKE